MSISRNVASPQQIAANRANAAKSTGPRSPEGKARSAQNARKHGFAAANYTVVRLEDAQEVANLRDDAVALYQPVNSQEMYAVERIALTQQALLRAARLEERVSAQSNAFTLYLRYSAQAERQYRRAIEEFERLKALRPELPNEPSGAGRGTRGGSACVPAEQPNEPEARRHFPRRTPSTEPHPAAPRLPEYPPIAPLPHSRRNPCLKSYRKADSR